MSIELQRLDALIAEHEGMFSLYMDPSSTFRIEGIDMVFSCPALDRAAWHASILVELRFQRSRQERFELLQRVGVEA